MDVRHSLVVGNWKMNGSLRRVRELVAGVRAGVRGLPGMDTGEGIDIGVCPPFVYIAEVSAALADTPVRCGGQNCAGAEEGAFTGEVSARMLVDLGCHLVLVGHSERRALYGESDAEVATKAALAFAAGLSPVICVGETLAQREAGQTESTVLRQLDTVIDGLNRPALDRIIIAYEPVWAIGTGCTATPAQANAVHALLRRRVAEHDPGVAADLHILYGGSVKPENAPALFAEPDIDGGLIGGASLEADQFIDICRAAY